MKKVDTIIVGMGIAAICFAETLQQKQKSFYVIDKNKNGSSKIAAGIYNPTVLKRYNMSWNGKKFHKNAIKFYKIIENRYNTKIFFEHQILKIFSLLDKRFKLKLLIIIFLMLFLSTLELVGIGVLAGFIYFLVFILGNYISRQKKKINFDSNNLFPF